MSNGTHLFWQRIQLEAVWLVRERGVSVAQRAKNLDERKARGRTAKSSRLWSLGGRMLGGVLTKLFEGFLSPPHILSWGTSEFPPKHPVHILRRSKSGANGNFIAVRRSLLQR